ncbi:hypothetical protein HUT06_39670 [Actinomadura sp. NAK00032]|uniref:hypothetical protein n=1 Tax=Actinomadura sp. NAK00032 TaxID=2742128 RepID=UPI00159020D9|nr:hypothetical protein [Actinomadura sp. NAK00032]QKW39400.1 hypothetical protein HUT06_39670 [Actinomadura sp. NAK00032]
MSAEQDEPSPASPSPHRPPHDPPHGPANPPGRPFAARRRPQDVHVAGPAPRPRGQAGGQTGGSVPPGGVMPGKGGRQGGSRRARVLVVAGAAAVAVVAAGAVAAVALGGDGEPAKKKPTATAAVAPPAWTAALGRRLKRGTGMRYNGTLTLKGGTVRARLQVAPSGAATGRLVAGTLTADVAAIDGTTYLKAGLAFWRAYAGEVPHPDYYAGRWSKAPASMPGFDVPDVLGPEAIAKALAKTSGTPPTEDVGGVRAYRVKTSAADYLVTAAAPYRLLAVRPAGQNAPSFTAAPVTAPAALFAELRPRVAALGGAGDPAVRFRPGTLTFSDCDQNTNGCTVRVPATLTAPSGSVPDGARAALRASITSRGEPLGSCRTSKGVGADRSVLLDCTVTGRLWRTWMKHALDNPGSYPYEASARVVGEAVAEADVPKLLARVDRERKAVLKPKPATPGPSATGGAEGTQGPSAKRSEGTEAATSQSPGRP